MEKTTKKDRLRELAEKYNLVKEDFFKVHNSVIITRTGIEKIQTVANIKLSYEIVALDLANKIAAVKCKAEMPNKEIGTRIAESYGESCSYNTKAAYPLAMAEKRAKARVILQLTEFYQLGVYSEDEADDFKKPQ